MRVHFIKDGVVINTVIQDTLDNPFGYLAVASDNAGPGYLWDGTSFTRPVPVKTAEQIRQERDNLLLQLDTTLCNPLRWNSFNEATKTAYGVYRQSLLDIPQQPGFPENIIWPTSP